ncbi:hypothetical protein WMW71_12960 [Flavobacterium buctense]|uniref:DUF4199 domain-containing protein n=1 Tax=Flavobacterium buctense TaxID=1648146 RepID=A0ABU9E5G1_9FLAO|nr:hypothetical protein [Flavobacterium buctense]
MEKTETKIKILAIYQLLGGLTGFIGTFYLMLKVSSVNSVILLFLGLYGFSIFCGYLLLKKSYIKGLNFSVINQLIQVLSFTICGFAYKFYSGLFLCLGLNLTTDTLITYNAGISTWNFKLNSESLNTELSVNIVALILINVIFNLRKKF